jgi:hypothetical protein
MGFIGSDADLLIIAGDLGTYNRQNIEFIRYNWESSQNIPYWVESWLKLYIENNACKKIKSNPLNTTKKLSY